MRIFPLLAILWVSAACGFAQDIGRMAEAVNAAAKADGFMGSVLVAKGDQVVFGMSVGWADAEWEIPNAATTKFRIGSLTKQFTAASILLLEERGKLSVDDPISKYIPGVPAAWSPITLRHLLTHRSGIPDFTALPAYPREWKYSGPSPSMIFNWVRDQPLEFSPGSKYQYSNTGYVLLGWIIEQVSGQAYREFVKQNIFDPLGLADSGYDSNTAIIPRRASGYNTGALGLRHANYIDMRTPHAAGGLYATTGDLLKWTQALFGGKLLQPSSLEKMTNSFRDGYAFGLSIGTKDERKRAAHAGGIDGFGSFLAYFPASGVTIVVLANIAGPAAPHLEERLEEIYFGR
ncbi:MAG: beta-lactamase family protein [Opitutaceae bacterium]|nr:beta-lactamase family protein [Opitutaceae bacterium]MBP9911891.1 beta-lactamase family protein [Opitutaceae bacterium]